MPRGKRKQSESAAGTASKSKSRKTAATSTVAVLNGGEKDKNAEPSGSSGSEVSNVVKRASPSAKVLKLRIEHWATELVESLRTELGELTASLNEQAPRRGSFEISLVQPDGEEVLLWSGLKKGPPRRLKFPEPEVVVQEAKKHLS